MQSINRKLTDDTVVGATGSTLRCLWMTLLFNKKRFYSQLCVFITCCCGCRRYEQQHFPIACRVCVGCTFSPIFLHLKFYFIISRASTPFYFYDSQMISLLHKLIFFQCFSNRIIFAWLSMIFAFRKTFSRKMNNQQINEHWFFADIETFCNRTLSKCECCMCDCI